MAVNSLVLPVRQEVADTRTYLEHNKGYCLSRQMHRFPAAVWYPLRPDVPATGCCWSSVHRFSAHASPDEQMFYLRSRGIEQDAAQTMIIHAFAAELTEALERRGCT
jgi:Fe-S cluster assembly protein SufD